MAIRIWVTVRPRARKEEVRKAEEGQYLAWVHAPPQKGKANEALIDLLANYFSVPKSAVRIIQGKAGRRKLVEVG